MTIFSSRIVEAGTDNDDVITRDNRQTQSHIRRPPRRSRGRRNLRIGISTPLSLPSSTTRTTPSSSWIHIDGSDKVVFNRVQFREQVFCTVRIGAARPECDAVESETSGYYCGYIRGRSWCNDNNRDESGIPTSALCTIADDSTCNPQGSSQYGAGIEFTQLSPNAVNINIRSGLYIREPYYGCWWWRTVVGESDPPATERGYGTGF